MNTDNRVDFSNISVHDLDDNGLPDVRRDMERRLLLPTWVIDWFTGKTLPDQGSKPNRAGPVTYLASDLAVLAGATALAAFAASGQLATGAALPLLLIAWFVQTGRLRKMQTLEGHEAAHGNFFPAGDPRREGRQRVLGLSLNDFFGELATAVALSVNVADYKASHDRHHDEATYTTREDPDTDEVLRARHFLWSLIDPWAYIRQTARRLWSGLATARPGRRALTVAVLAILGGLALILPGRAWIAAIAVPWILLFRISGLLQLMSLHAWLLPPVADAQAYADRTFGRFSGRPLPVRGLTGLAWWRGWAAWWAEILFVELPFRLAVLSPDLQAHDVHHLEWILVHDLGVLPAFVDDWRNQPFRRAEVIRDSGDPLGMGRREYWGVRAFIGLSRENLSRLRRAV